MTGALPTTGEPIAVAGAAEPTNAGSAAARSSAIDLTTTVERTKVRIDRDRNPFAEMSSEERMRLFIRVLCELVAYDELDEPEPSTASPA